jgi:hypothetical protein|tara:strand:+ start:869 stop:1531 length:663 start_codon:yes stop_codon:yes gene_type:complete
MARLFITPREINFINDLTKELIKDVVGQKIYYYSISVARTKINELYDEAPEKVFESPVEIECLVDYQEPTFTTNRYGVEKTQNIEAFIQSRDLLDRQIEIDTGDFFTYGSVIFEITSVTVTKNIFGQIEHNDGIKVIGKQSRKQVFFTRVLGPTDEELSDPDAVQETFVQQRGFATNDQGETGDVRELQRKGVLEKPITKPKEVSERGDPTSAGSAFYDE